ncbi:histidine-histamine antiporter [Lysobacter helvus]|uniref:Arginine/agmatine antiporter n=2 Tax=Lysobacteraceae TaxID=32033 RepID=A0ABM7Q976_9GAMM|nr:MULTISPECIES: amino acid permease [Lysobacter]BCT93931.1 histidine-histamine antiporter [Lysobacter caseinilyticus]BCT97087.1 histidine-histamine antiporter [Lysobacter helvus]
MHGGTGDKKMGLVAATSLVVANMVGTGLFLLPSSLAAVGSISVFGWLVSTLGATALGLVFVRLSSSAPKAGGPYAYARDAVGPFAAFQTNTLYWGASVLGNVAIAVSVTGYLAVFAHVLESPVPACICTILVIWLFVWLNTRGASSVGHFTTITTVAGILPVAVVGLLGWFWFDRGVFDAGWNPSNMPAASAVMTSASIALWAFLGVESAAVSAGVIENPKRNVPLATIMGLAISAVIYVSCCTVIMGILPNAQLQSSHAPFAEVASVMLGPWAGSVIAIAAILKASGSLVGWILIAAQSSQAAATDGMFPQSFSRLNANGMPARNLVVTGVLMTALVILTASPTLSEQFSRITNATVILMALPYIYSVMAMWRMDRAAHRTDHLAASIVVGVAACLYCVGVAIGQSHDLVFKAMIALLLTTPLFALVRLQDGQPRVG